MSDQTNLEKSSQQFVMKFRDSSIRGYRMTPKDVARLQRYLSAAEYAVARDLIDYYSDAKNNYSAVLVVNISVMSEITGRTREALTKTIQRLCQKKANRPAMLIKLPGAKVKEANTYDLSPLLALLDQLTTQSKREADERKRKKEVIERNAAMLYGLKRTIESQARAHAATLLPAHAHALLDTLTQDLANLQTDLLQLSGRVDNDLSQVSDYTIEEFSKELARKFADTWYSAQTAQNAEGVAKFEASEAANDQRDIALRAKRTAFNPGLLS